MDKSSLPVREVVNWWTSGETCLTKDHLLFLTVYEPKQPRHDLLEDQIHQDSLFVFKAKYRNLEKTCLEPLLRYFFFFG